MADLNDIPEEDPSLSDEDEEEGQEPDGITAVNAVLTVCGANAAQRMAIRGEGFESLDDFLLLQLEDVVTMTTNITRLSVNRGGTRLGAIITKKLQGLVHWCHEQARNGRPLIAAEFTPITMRLAIEKMAVEDNEDGSPPELPGEFKAVKWVPWAKQLENYLSQVKGRNNVPLAYIVRKPRDPNQGAYRSEEERNLYSVAHRGEAYKADNKKVFQILTQTLSGTPAWTWISKYESSANGRLAMKALRDHYNGPGEVEKRIAFAYNELNHAYYRSERAFSFEAYITKLSEAFEILEDHGVPKHEREKVDYLLNGMQAENQLVTSAKTTVRMTPSMRTSFNEAANRISELIGSTMQNTSSRGQKPARKIAGAKRGNNNTTANQGHKKMVNGVDITDKTRNYPKKEWFKLPQEIRDEITALRAKKKEERKVAATETTSNEIDEEKEKPTPTGNGQNFGSGAYKKVKIKSIMTGMRRVMSIGKRNNSSPDTPGKCEIDNHADTTCFGQNFTPIHFTGQSCDVIPFSEKYAARKDIPIASAATAWDNPTTGETTILIFHQGLWFGDELKDSLINPNQCRMNGIDLCDDAWDPNRKLGIKDEHTGLWIPMELAGSIVSFATRSPTMQEINTLPKIEMTSEAIWDPSRATRKGISAVITHDSTAMPGMESMMTEKAILRRMAASVHVWQTYGDSRRVSKTISTARHATIDAEAVSRAFGCGLETARKTLEATTQRAVRHAKHPLSRRYRTDILQTWYRRLKTVMYTDTMFMTTKSLKGNTCAQVFTNGRYVHLEPMATKAAAGSALDDFIGEVGVPDTMVFDNAREQVGHNTEFMKTIRKQHMNWRSPEPYAHWQNRAEDQIRELRRKWRTLKVKQNVPSRLWDFGLVHIAKTMTLTARGKEGRTPYEEITGDTPDISEYVDFRFFDWVWYWDLPGAEENPKIGRWLGVSHRIGAAMCFYILTEACEVISRTTVQHITEEEKTVDSLSQQMEQFTKAVEPRLSSDKYTITTTEENVFHLDDDPEGEEHVAQMEEDPKIPEADDYDDEAYDEYIGAQLILPLGEQRMQGRVTKRSRDGEGKPIGRRNNNPLHDTRRYEVELSDGTVQEYYANIIAESMISQVDSKGQDYLLLREITDHRKDQSVVAQLDHGKEKDPKRRNKMKTTKGWKLLVEWKEGGSDWIPLKDLKESNPVQVAEYAVANHLEDEPAFSWWVSTVLRKRNRILGKVKSRYWRTTHKFGIQLPHSVEQALELDKKNQNDYWRNAIEKEMSKINSMGTFEEYKKATPKELREGTRKLPGFQEIKCHLIFDIKMDGKFTRKARLVAGGHLTRDVPSSLTYSSVVSRESVRIGLLYASLNDLQILGCDVSNAYLNAKCREKVWIQAGKEFGTLEGKVMIIRKAIYGLKSSGYSWRQMLSQSLLDMGYETSIADPDVYLRKAYKQNGEPYYEWLLTYVDDCLCISDSPETTMDRLGKLYELRDTVCEPDRYLGANVGKWQLPDGREAWSLSPKEYVRNAVKLVRGMMENDGTEMRFGKAADRPMPRSYRPELDTSKPLSDELVGRYQQMIGILRWAVELGRIDIMFEVSQLSSYLAYPREGHLGAAYNMFAYLGKHPDSTMVFDSLVPKIEEEAFTPTDWTESIYGDVQEEDPPKMRPPLGKPVVMTCFVDADHAGNKITRRSHTGFIIYLNNAPIDWFSKRQNSVETSTFGSEYVAMRIATERVKALRYKLKMFGIPIAGPTNMLGDNESVVNSASKIEARLAKKHNAICFHMVREACAAGWIRVGWEPTETNVADLLTKQLDTMRRRQLLQLIFVKGG